MIAKCTYATPDPVQPDHQYLCVHCIPFVLLIMFHLSSQHYYSKLLPSSCCVTCSDPLMLELNLAMKT